MLTVGPHNSCKEQVGKWQQNRSREVYSDGVHLPPCSCKSCFSNCDFLDANYPLSLSCVNCTRAKHSHFEGSYHLVSFAMENHHLKKTPCSMKTLRLPWKVTISPIKSHDRCLNGRNEVVPADRRESKVFPGCLFDDFSIFFHIFPPSFPRFPFKLDGDV